ARRLHFSRPGRRPEQLFPAQPRLRLQRRRDSARRGISRGAGRGFAAPDVSLQTLWNHDLAYSFRRSPVTITAAVLALVCIGGAVLAPWIAPYNPFDAATLDLNKALAPPAWIAEGSSAYLLGTDDQGRDILSTILYGARISLGVGVAAV